MEPDRRSAVGYLSLHISEWAPRCLFKIYGDEMFYSKPYLPSYTQEGQLLAIVSWSV